MRKLAILFYEGSKTLIQHLTNMLYCSPNGKKIKITSKGH